MLYPRVCKNHPQSGREKGMTSVLTYLPKSKSTPHASRPGPETTPEVVAPSQIRRRSPPKPPKAKSPPKINKATTESLPSLPPPSLPNGDFASWKYFLDNGGYVLSSNKRMQVLAFVSPILNPTGDDFWRNRFMERQVQFHNRLKSLREEFGDAPRDLWETCLPDKSVDWYEFAVLLLMICSSMIPDQKLVPFMALLFSENTVTPEFVLQKHKEDSLFWEKRLLTLGRNVSNSKYIIAAAETTLALGRVPRNYRAIVQNYKGVGPKMALVSVHTAYNDVVSDLS
jgi:hypothetical protein